jgi:hypothetical protein
MPVRAPIAVSWSHSYWAPESRPPSSTQIVGQAVRGLFRKRKRFELKLDEPIFQRSLLSKPQLSP